MVAHQFPCDFDFTSYHVGWGWGGQGGCRDLVCSGSADSDTTEEDICSVLTSCFLLPAQTQCSRLFLLGSVVSSLPVVNITESVSSVTVLEQGFTFSPETPDQVGVINREMEKVFVATGNDVILNY